VQLTRVDRVENFLRCAVEEPQPQSRSQQWQWHWWHYGTDLSKRWGFTTECAFGTTKGAPEGEAVQCFCAKSRHAVGTPATHRFDAVPGNASGTTRSSNAIDPTVPTAAAPSITAPAAAASTMGAACSTVPSAANSVAGARLVDFAHGWYVKGQARGLGVDLR
jgi:hypothetical protein